MRQLQRYRFVGLLWLALFSTVVLPWAHELSHLVGHHAVVLTPGAPAAPHATPSDWQAAPEAATDTPDTAEAELCLVCTSLQGRHILLSDAGSPALAPPYLAGPSHKLGECCVRFTADWLAPAPRAPPYPA